MIFNWDVGDVSIKKGQSLTKKGRRKNIGGGGGGVGGGVTLKENICYILCIIAYQIRSDVNNIVSGNVTSGHLQSFWEQWLSG